MTKQIDLNTVSYRVIAYPKGGAPVEITTLCETIKHSESEDRFVADLQIKLKNVKERQYGWIHSHVKVTTPIRLQAKEGKGGKWTTIFNGLIYKWATNAADHTIELTAYDLLYPVMQSEEHYYFKDGETAKQAIEKIAKDKGIKLKPIKGLATKLDKKVATGGIHETIKERIEAHNKKSPKKYLVRADLNGHMEVVERGTNSTIYEITDWSIAESTHEISIEDIVTVVKVYGKSENDERPPVKATHKRNTALGEIVAIINDSGDEKSEADKEAKELLDEKSKPKKTLNIRRTVDIPWVRKGDKIRAATGTAGSYKNGKQVPVSYIIKSVTRHVESRTMSLELEM